ncbi:MAG: hypothetical protein NTZ04_01760, partial [Chloroflexi bacterium]|nr:hypothetical protein [Chloroflexota bacterium]
ATISGGGTTYNVAVSGMTGNGTVIASIDQNKAHDAAGNANTASTSTDNQVNYVPSQPNTPVGSNVTVVLNGMTITFANVSVAGNTTVTQETAPCGSGPGSLPAGYRPIGATYHITTDATHTGNVTVVRSYDPSSTSDAQNLRLFHCGGTGWKDVTTSVNTVNNIIYGQDSTLSWWQIGDPGAGAHSGSVFPSIYIAAIAVAAAGVIGYAIYRRRAKA